MSVKTKMGGFFTLLVVVAVVAGVYLVKTPTQQQTGRDEKEVIVAALWDPNPRLPDGMAIEVLNGGRAEVDTTTNRAPYTKVFWAKPGTIVEVRIRLLGSGETRVVGCSLTVEGIVVETQTGKNVGRGYQLICRAVV